MTEAIEVLTYVFFVVVVGLGIRDRRGLWRGEGGYYATVARGMRASWLWGDRYLFAFLRSAPAGHLTLLGILFWKVASDLKDRHPAIDQLRGGLLLLVGLGLLTVASVQVLGQPSFLIAPPMRNPPNRAVLTHEDGAT